jgi:ABC-type cobalt transport system substrate-binding protein
MLILVMVVVVVMVMVVVVVVVVTWASSDTVAEIRNNRLKQSIVWEPPDSDRWQAAALRATG